MFVATSTFVVANGMVEEVKEAFRNRPHLVDNVPGFIRMDVMTPVENPEEFWLITYWLDQDSWKTWYRSHSYKAAHEGIPKGLKLVPEDTRVRYFDLVSQ